MNLTEIRKDIKVDRSTASRFRLHGLINRMDMACPGVDVVLKDVPYAKALKMNNISDLNIKNCSSEWVHVKNNDHDTINTIYSENLTKPAEEVVVSTEEEAPVVETEPVVEDEDLDEFDEEDEEVVEEATTEDNVVEETTTEEDTVDNKEESVEENTEEVAPTTDNIQRVVSSNENTGENHPKYNTYNKYNKKKK